MQFPNQAPDGGAPTADAAAGSDPGTGPARGPSA